MPSGSDGSSNTTLLKALEALIATFDERAISYAIIGGVATLQHTRTRVTDDIDALMTVPQIAMPGFFEALKDHQFSLEVPRTIREFRDEGMTVVQYEHVLVDLLRPSLPAYQHVIDRAVEREVMGRKVRVASAEGLIVMKLIAMRPQDEADIHDLLDAYGSRLQLDYVRAEIDTLMHRDDPRRVKFEQMVARASGAAGR